MVSICDDISMGRHAKHNASPYLISNFIVHFFCERREQIANNLHEIFFYQMIYDPNPHFLS